jgi:hypothetical protein
MLGGTSIVVLDLMQAFADVPGRTVGLVEIPATLCVLFGLPGLYLRQAPRAGYLGLAAFVLVFTGVALGMGHFYLLAFARSVLDTEWPDAAAAVEAAWRTIAPLELLTFAGGWVLFAVTTLRSKTFPRPAAILILVGIVMVFVRPLLPFEGPVGGVLMGAGIAWLGMALFRSDA